MSGATPAPGGKGIFVNGGDGGDGAAGTLLLGANGMNGSSGGGGGGGGAGVIWILDKSDADPSSLISPPPTLP